MIRVLPSFRSKLGHGLVSGNFSKSPTTEGTDEEKAANEVFVKI